MTIRIQPPLYGKPARIHQQHDRNTFDAVRFYRSSKWTRCSRRHRAAEPFCRSCRTHGLLIVGVLTDHIVPIHCGGAPYDEANLQTLCARCHDIKRQRESQRKT